MVCFALIIILFSSLLLSHNFFSIQYSCLIPFHFFSFHFAYFFSSSISYFAYLVWKFINIAFMLIILFSSFFCWHKAMQIMFCMNKHTLLILPQIISSGIRFSMRCALHSSRNAWKIFCFKGACEKILNQNFNWAKYLNRFPLIINDSKHKMNLNYSVYHLNDLCFLWLNNYNWLFQ